MTQHDDAARYTDRLERARELCVRAQHAAALDILVPLVGELTEAVTGESSHADGLRRLLVRALVTRSTAVDAIPGEGDAGGDLEQAAAHAALLGDRELAAVVDGQRGLIFLRTGSPTLAHRMFTSALSGLPRTNHRDMAITLINRGSASIDLGDVNVGLRDYLGAQEHARKLGHPYYVAFADHNVGYAKSLLGDLPGALADMDRSYQHAPDQDDGIPLLGKAEVLVEAGLWTEADAALAEAIPQLQRAGFRLDLAEAEYFRARTFLGLRRFADAKRWGALARRHFEDGGHASWAVTARALELEVEVARARVEGTPSPAVCRRRAAAALDVADRGASTGAVLGREPAVEARLIAIQWLVSAAELDAARAVLDEVPARLHGAPLSLRVQRCVVAAELAFAAGDRPAGLRAVRHGFGVLAAHRTRLGSVESLTAASVHGLGLNWADVDAAARTRRPASLFDALERGRAAFAGAARVTPPDDPVAAELLSTARALLARARDLPVDTDPAAAREAAMLRKRAKDTQHQLRERSWQRPGDASVQRPVHAREVLGRLVEQSDGAVVASFAVIQGRVVAVRAGAQGMTLVDLADAADVAERIRRVRADLQIVSNDLIPPALHRVAVASLGSGLRHLDDLLVRPLRAEGALYVAARDPLIGLPWSSLPSRRGLPTAVNSYVARGRAVGSGAVDARVVAAAGPGVPRAADEVRAVATVWPGGAAWVAGAATASAVRDALGDHDVVHLAAHGRHDADNPLFAQVGLADGPLFAHELDGLRLPQSVVVLSACEVGGATPGLAGEVLGLTSVLLRLGARAVVASVAPLSDEVAAEVMPRFHQRLRDGAEPEEALARALEDVEEPVPLVCFASLPGLAA
ncbi:CHAT domain-containing protein [Luteimicrobium subarcticum]|uniref:CHAT domain-containing protein n=1 Tax=Luteimicrobium subarcticum TaxID=620910 RepID=A0A2M8WVI3_9MICO|nr:CHAT domain-containing protein [Luteimicrobium subarcticum]PJI94934.1 CHAT domain-containing protein [Luteimicrobium subarcticum]